MKKIVVIDDSALMRKHLRQILEGAGYAVAVARNGEEGLQRIREVSPQAVTLDINMPVMDGLTCLSHIMTEMPLPVVMVSSLTEKGALATFEALELGAVDYVAKPGGTVSLNIHEVANDLLAKVGTALTARIGKRHGLRGRLRAQRERSEAERLPTRRTATGVHEELAPGLVIVGVSTGGPATLEGIVYALPADFPLPILVAQHMPARFTGVFAQRLNKNAAVEVKELDRLTPLRAGQVLIARGDADVKLGNRAGKLTASSIPASDQFLWHPSVARMAQSVQTVCDPTAVICVQLTGMGNDGAKTMAELHTAGARTIAESEETAVIYGMPRALVELGGADCVLPAYRIADQLTQWALHRRLPDVNVAPQN